MINNFEKRKKRIQNLNKSIKFNHKIVILGLGAIGTLLVNLISNIVDMDIQNLIVIDKNKFMFEKIKDIDATKITEYILPSTIDKIFIDLLKLNINDIIIDSSFEIDTLEMYKFCHKHGISYINSAVEDWPDGVSRIKEYDTYADRIEMIAKHNKNIEIKNTNFIIGLGCNPGNVNLWVLYALQKINDKFYKIKEDRPNFLAQRMGLNTIHISEKDSQITNNPKRVNEYLNTWASNKNSWYDEAFSYVEVSWGTHEKKYPKNMLKKTDKHQLIINNTGCCYFGRTFVPSTPRMMGMMIRHEECYTIANYLSIKYNGNNLSYQPSCYYIYNPNDSSKASIYEVLERDFKYQDNQRLMTMDITDGSDEVGATLFFEDGNVFWVGSILSIKESRELFDNKLDDFINATLLQVVAGYLGGLNHIINLINENKYLGLILPENIPLKEYMNITKPFLGIFGIFKVNWQSKYTHNKWRFEEFLVNL
jgi:homospermidine synthase